MRVRLIAMLRAVTVCDAASTCGSIAPAYSAVHDPAALSAIQSPRVWLLSNTPAVTGPLLLPWHSTAHPRQFVRGLTSRDRTGCVAAGLRDCVSGQSTGDGRNSRAAVSAIFRPAPHI